jgi:hypothetical protein
MMVVLNLFCTIWMKWNVAVNAASLVRKLTVHVVNCPCEGRVVIKKYDDILIFMTSHAWLRHGVGMMRSLLGIIGFLREFRLTVFGRVNFLAKVVSVEIVLWCS